MGLKILEKPSTPTAFWTKLSILFFSNTGRESPVSGTGAGEKWPLNPTGWGLPRIPTSQGKKELGPRAQWLQMLSVKLHERCDMFKKRMCFCRNPPKQTAWEGRDRDRGRDRRSRRDKHGPHVAEWRGVEAVQRIVCAPKCKLHPVASLRSYQGLVARLAKAGLAAGAVVVGDLPLLRATREVA